MRGGNNNLLTVRKHLMDIKRHIACAWRQIEQHIVKLSPADIAEELAEHFA
ncbi:hypothetical protein D3C74_463090 [compost metagenome]